MSSCQEFNVTFSGPAEELVAKAKTAVEDAGGTFNGDTEKGEFKVPTPFGPVAGTYRIAASKVYIQITEKPLLLPCWVIENFVRQWIPPLEMLPYAAAVPSCQFKFEFKGSAQALVDKARKLVEKNGGTFHGNTSNGSFEVLGVKGRYQISGQTFTVYIDEKPWYITCGMIEAIIKSNLP